MARWSSLFPTESVWVVEHEVSRDARGRPTVRDVPREVEGALVSPPDTSALQQLGANVTFRIDWPKTDHTDLTGREVVVRGHRYAVVGSPQWYATAPGPFDRPVYVTTAAQAVGDDA